MTIPGRSARAAPAAQGRPIWRGLVSQTVARQHLRDLTQDAVPGDAAAEGGR